MKKIPPKLNVRLNRILSDNFDSKFISSKKLRKELSNSFNRIKHYYKGIINYNRLEPQDRWIYENYFTIERVYKESYHSLKNEHFLASNNRTLPDLFVYLIEAVDCDDFILNQDTLIELIKLFQKERPLLNFEFDFLNLFIKASSIVLISKAIKECFKENCTSRIERLIGILTSVDLINFATINCSFNKLEAILLQDPTGVYNKQNDKTKNMYRYKISKSAYYEKRDELSLAKFLICKSRIEKKHVGFYIYKHYKKVKPKNPITKHHIKLCFFVPAILSFFVCLWIKNFWIALLIYPLMYELTRPIIEKFTLKRSEVTYPPRLELYNNVPKEMQTLVVISTLLPSGKELEKLPDKLIKMLLQNKDGSIGFCLLCDLKSSNEQHQKEDTKKIDAVKKIVKQLNEEWGNRFILLVRQRSYSKTQDEYTGYERKRGAITDLIQLINGKDIFFKELYGNKDFLYDTKYILTLDYDTCLKINTIPNLVSIAAHPLNRPVVNNEKGVVTSGYGIISPRMTLDLKASQKTYFSMIYGGIGGTTTYDASCSELYQDIYDRAIFSGKGLIDVSAYQSILPNLFSDETLLSHDIIEGGFLRALYASDVELIESYPSDGVSYFKRLNRWIRGDFQNTNFIAKTVTFKKGKFNNPLDKTLKFQLFDNLRRAVTPIFSVLSVIIAMFVGANSRIALVLLAIFGTISPYFHSFVNLIISGSLSAFTTKFYSKFYPIWVELFYSSVGNFLLIPQFAYVSADAAIKGIYRRYFSKKKMLEWSTALQVESKKNSMLSRVLFYLPQLVIGTFLLFAKCLGLKIIGLLFILQVPILFLLKKSPIKQVSISQETKTYLTKNLNKMLSFYFDFAGEKDNFLPPDNMQKAPVYRIAHRTSPTNIGLMLISYLTARDFQIIDTNRLYYLVNQSITTVEKLKKYHGNLYNWYDTKTLDTLKPEFVSTVDSGNFVCCLVALKEGLKEYQDEQNDIIDLVSRIEAIIESTNLSKFYCKQKGLFSIGYDVDNDELYKSHYDLLMSEARMTSYFAISKGLVPTKHWSALSRAMSRTFLHAGPISWSGTTFEYFMPELMLHCINGSIGREALNYCIGCQLKRAKKSGVPFGISESAIYAFDNNLNYQYKTNGVQKIALKRGMDDELVVSPYSSYLMLPFATDKSYHNLLWLDKLKATGQYGHYEAIDYTKSRVDDKYVVIKSYMAHHIGMSIVAINNALKDNIMQKRFLRDKDMDRATELLNEKNSVGEVMLQDLLKKKIKKHSVDKEGEPEFIGTIFPQQPRVKVLANTDMSCILTGSGSSYIKCNKTDILRRPVDLLRDPKGSFCFIKFDNDIYSTTFAPGYNSSVMYETAFSKSSVEYYAKTDKCKVKTTVRMHSILPCEQREVSIENLNNNAETASLLFYIEPSLANVADDSAHPAFSKLFICIEKDVQTNTIIAKRKIRGSEDIYYVAVGFRDDISFDYEANRENLFSRTNISSVKPSAFTDEFVETSGVPNPCIAIRTNLNLAKKQKKSVFLLTSVSTTKADAIANIVAMREQEPIESELSATSKLPYASLEYRIGQTILPQILFNKRDSKNNLNAIKNNELNPQSLWQLSISGDYPIVVVDVLSETDTERVEAYLKCHSLLKLSFIEFDLVFLYNESDKINDMIKGIIQKYENLNTISSRAGIHIVDKSKLNEELTNFIYASACHIATRSLTRIELPTKKYIPIKINNCQKGNVDVNSNLSILGGEFTNNSFFVTQTPKLPWCHILANSTFGTLVSDKALGFTWAINARENKLTPWYNDTVRDNQGEMLILKLDDKYYDVINGSKAEFSPQYVKYYSTVDELSIITTITVPAKGMIKYIDVELINNSTNNREVELAYYIEPVLSFSRKNSRQINCNIIDNILLLHNPFNASVSSHLSLTSYSDKFHVCCDKPSFLCGSWDEEKLLPCYDNCASLIVKKTIEPKKIHTISYAMAFATTKKGAYELIKLKPNKKYKSKNSINVKSSDKSVDALINTWLPWQILSSRLWGRTGFYQCGGAYGFRDQLQDVCGYMILEPSIAKQHILRCCASQFEAGDVFHWWHTLPKDGMGKKGVRTRYTDDMVWLPYTVCRYVKMTGDISILDIKTAYLVANELDVNQKSNYIDAQYTDYKETVYSHCIKALDRAYKLGNHSLIKIGCGDWNDGYSSVGINGEGESVWLSQFLSLTMNLFSDICIMREDVILSEKYIEYAKGLLKAVDENGFDGQYYLRAYFDNGDKMGSKDCDECRIDSLTQSFSAISNMSDKNRIKDALNFSYDNIVDEKNGIIKLFTPAFDISDQEPGYVKSYPSGVRENGGQYTHAAVWFAIAMSIENMKEKFFTLTKLLNPIKKYQNEDIAKNYLLEPYYMAADIYTNKDAYGRGGWSIYTGTASWYYQLLVEYMLGIKILNDKVKVNPMLPTNNSECIAKIKFNDKEIELDIKADDKEKLYKFDNKSEENNVK